MPFDAADFNWRGDPMPSRPRPRHRLWDLLDSLKEMVWVLVALVVASSAAFALDVLLYGFPDLLPVGTDISKLPPAPSGSQIVCTTSFCVVLAAFGWWRVRRMMPEWP